MNDTSEEVETLLRQRYMEMSGEQRFLAGARMFEAARTMVLASAPPDMSESDIRHFLCKRFYGAEFADRMKK